MCCRQNPGRFRGPRSLRGGGLFVMPPKKSAMIIFVGGPNMGGFQQIKQIVGCFI